jgi:Na+-translocating ferredoxin:NAD+ oxidoreductase RnfG subunit
MQLVTQVLGRLMAQILIVYTSIKGLLSTLVNNLHVKFIQVSQNVANLQLLNQLVKIKQSISRLVASLIIQAQLIKVGVIYVLHKLGSLGQQLLTTARQILQRAK